MKCSAVERKSCGNSGGSPKSIGSPEIRNPARKKRKREQNVRKLWCRVIKVENVIVQRKKENPNVPVTLRMFIRQRNDWYREKCLASFVVKGKLCGTDVERWHEVAERVFHPCVRDE